MVPVSDNFFVFDMNNTQQRKKLQQMFILIRDNFAIPSLAHIISLPKSLSLFLSQTLELSCYGKFGPSNYAEIFNMVIPNWSELILGTYRKVMWLRVIFIWFFEYKISVWSKCNVSHKQGNLSDKISLIVINLGCKLKKYFGYDIFYFFDNLKEN